MKNSCFSLLALFFCMSLVFGCARGGKINVTKELCDNGIDDDGDGLIDCDDPDCADDPACEVPVEICDDGIDNDGDDLVDCDDPDCVGDPACEVPAEICDDGIDNDGDDLVDCEDPDCAEDPACEGLVEICNNGVDDDDNGLVDCKDPACFGRPGPGGGICEEVETRCNDGYDNDANGLTDCADPACDGRTGPGGGICEEIETRCNDNYDNDGDGFIDCQDPDCQFAPVCQGPQEICNNGIDDDGDGAVDCQDADCVGQTGPGGGICELPEASCNDGYDNDGDGLVDCADPDCAASPHCQAPVEICNDGIDNDGDTLIDCADPDCVGQLGPGGCVCQSVETNCNDGCDNDGDGLVDCFDPDCASASNCIATCDRNYVFWDSPPSCATGNKCGLNSSTQPACLPNSNFYDAGTFYASCGPSDTCPFGSACHILGFGKRCYPLCDNFNTPAQHPCPGTGICAYVLTANTDFGLCKDADGCNVAANSGCPLNYSCQLFSDLYCFPTAWATVPLGGNCTVDLCQGGHICANDGTGSKCFRACQISSPTTCTGGQSCVGAGHDVYGVCYPL